MKTSSFKKKPGQGQLERSPYDLTERRPCWLGHCWKVPEGKLWRSSLGAIAAASRNKIGCVR
jgi:hypothetical protein